MRRLATTPSLGSLGLVGAAALWIFLALLATPASAVFSYPSPQTLSGSGQSALDPRLAIDGSDRATIVWHRSDGSNPRIQSVRLAANGVPEAVQTLSPAGEAARVAEVAIDGSDRATIAWDRSAGDPGPIQSVRLAADGTPEAVRTLSAAGQKADQPKIAIDGSDRATVTWRRSDGANDWIESVRLGADGAPGAVQTLSEAGQHASPAIAIDGSDRATIAWQRNGRIQSVRLAADGTPGAVQTLSDAGQDANNPQVAIDGSDRATVVWHRSDGTDTRIQSVRLAADGTPEAVQTLSESGEDRTNAQIAIDGSDRATVAWRRDTVSDRIESVRLAADGTPGTIQTLSWSVQDASQPRIAIDGSDRATVTWQGSDGTRERIQSVRLAADGTPGLVQTLSDAGQNAIQPQVAIDGSGLATMTWARSDGSNLRVQSVRAQVVLPNTTITSGPSGLTNDASPAFGFSSDAPQSTFECRLDAGAWSTCASPKSYSSLSDGPHTFAVRAIDAEDDTDPTPAERSFDLDTTPPQTTIDSGPTDPTNDNTPTFEFSSSEANSTFECRLDSGSWSACSSPETLAALADGPHSFEVRASDEAGNTDPSPAERSFTVDTQPPTLSIDSGPSGPTNDTTPTFGFSAEAGASVECSIDTGTASFGPCSGASSHSPAAPLADDDYTFRVRATDPVGNPGTETRAFTVDTVAPAKPTFSGTDPASPANDNTPLIRGSANSTVKIYDNSNCTGTPKASGDSADFASPGIEVTVADDTTTTFYATATDAADNTSECSTDSITYTEDSTEPNTTITSGPSGSTNDATPTFEFSSSEANSSFECRLDSAAFAPCTSPKSYSSLADGPHTFSVRAIDPTGSTDSSPAMRMFTLDTSPPPPPPPPPPPRPLPSPLPIATDAVLEGSATAAKKQRQQGEKIVVEVKVKATEDLDAKASGTIKVNPTYKLKPRRAVVSAGKSKLLKLKPKKRKDAEKIVKALRRGKNATAKLTVKLIDGFGNRKVERLSVSLRHGGAR